MKKSLDKHYLSLQFQNKIFSKDGTEFQSFFEDIMEKAFSDFQKIRPYGNQGDGGNDGYRESLGIYYQVYAPMVPKVNEKEAAEKFEEDFQKLKNVWDKISNIKEYNFVFNDKYLGSVQLLEEAKARLKVDNPNVEFKLFLANDLEDLFFQLKESDILDLGFNIDQRQAVSNANTYLENVKTELDRENAIFAQKLLENVGEIILELGDENLILEYEILECRCLQKLEKIDEVKEKYESLSKRYFKDSRPLLHLAEIYLNEKNFNKNMELLEKAEKIDPSYWLLKLERVIRQNHLGEKIEQKDIDETTFPNEANLKASYYRVYGLILDELGDYERATSFIEKAIYLDPDRFSNYVIKLALAELNLIRNQDGPQRLQLSQELLAETEKVENKFLENGEIGPRNRAILNSYKLTSYLMDDNISSFESLSKENFDLLMVCNFDKQIENALIRILQYVLLPINELDKLLEYLKKSPNIISDTFSKVLIAQFNMHNILSTSGKSFFQEMGAQKYLEFINDIENQNDEKVIAFLQQDIPFAITFTNTIKESPDLRKKIIESLPDDGQVQKEKLKLLLSFDEKNYDEAFKTLQELDLSKLNYFECMPTLYIAQQKKAWDFEIVILKKLLEKERGKKEIFNLKSQLFNAYLSSNKFLDAIDIGEQLLKENSVEKFFISHNQEVLLNNTLYACHQRGKIDREAFKKSKNILETYQLTNPSFEFKVGVEAEVYISNNEPENALKAVIEGVKLKKILSSQEYAKLHFHFIRIGNLIGGLNKDTLESVQEDTFVKLKDKSQWYFIGEKHELDALLIDKASNKYSLFINKKVGEDIVFENKYSLENQPNQIELIFPIEKYILWKVVENFQELAKLGDLEGVQVIEIPQKDNTIDPQNLLRFFEDIHTRTEPLFELYCKNNVPLAMLAINEGGLVNALGKIQQEGKGFINFSDGAVSDLEKQKEIARKVIDEKTPFYIDGTSAIFLSEIGLLQKIYPYIKNLKIPQSVINLLADVADRFHFIPGQTGDRMGYAKGQIFFSSVERDKGDLLRSKFIASIKLFESSPENISIISSANKKDCLSEGKCLPELSDACILAQKENLPILTEDFLYLKLNQYETKKAVPEYFSSWALARVCYEKGFITFDEYLDYFGYLSSYRFRFLSLSSDDIEKAVFSNGGVVKPENIRKFNFPFTLSEEYGVLLQDAVRVVGNFFFRVMMDDNVALEITEKIYVEIVESFPAKVSQKDFGEKLLGACITVFENNISKSKTVCRLQDKHKHQKIDRLLQILDSFSTDVRPLATN
ncbi:MAG: hypothetical protein KF758_04055 [Anaerolineales bacterium]|nr:hypothetical protein [Anaerolineales bacterium]MBX3036067.1 hypothetical protein [Anaerolineales bacterium]